MRKLTFTLAAAACALIVSACQDTTMPVTDEPGTTISVPSTAGLITVSLPGAGAKTIGPSFAGSNSDTPCVGVLPPGTYQSVVVPPGAFCTLIGSVVTGNVRALENSTLLARNNNVGGNVELLGTFFVSLQGGNIVGGNVFGEKFTFLVDVVNLAVFGAGPNVIKGNVQLKEGANVGVCGNRFTDGNIEVQKNAGGSLLAGGLRCRAGFGDGNIVDKGNLKFEENNVLGGSGLQIGDNLVAQNLQVFKNRGAGLKTVTLNTVGKDLQCFDNDLPFVGGPNTAQKAEGQCF